MLVEPVILFCFDRLDLSFFSFRCLIAEVALSIVAEVATMLCSTVTQIYKKNQSDIGEPLSQTLWRPKNIKISARFHSDNFAT